MARLIIDEDGFAVNEMQVNEYEDSNGQSSLELQFDLKGQSKLITFNLSRDDAKELAKKILDLI